MNCRFGYALALAKAFLSFRKISVGYGSETEIIVIISMSHPGNVD